MAAIEREKWEDQQPANYDYETLEREYKATLYSTNLLEVDPADDPKEYPPFVTFEYTGDETKNSLRVPPGHKIRYFRVD